jgi:hypothetical protein
VPSGPETFEGRALTQREAGARRRDRRPGGRAERTQVRMLGHVQHEREPTPRGGQRQASVERVLDDQASVGAFCDP